MSNTSGGVGICAVIAVILSWSVNHSIFWALVHGMFGLLYIVYYLLGFGH